MLQNICVDEDQQCITVCGNRCLSSFAKSRNKIREENWFEKTKFLQVS